MGTYIYYDKLEDYEKQYKKSKEYEKLKEENKRLKDKVLELSNYLTLYSSEETLLNRINKTIEYILYTDLSTMDKIKLQEILRGEDNE